MPHSPREGSKGRRNSCHAWPELFLSEFGRIGEGILRGFSDWLAGRKTYLLAGVTILVLLFLVFLGKLTPESGCVLVAFAVSGFAVTFRHALERHHQAEVSLLLDIATAGLAYRQHNRGALASAAEAALHDGTGLATDLNKEKGS